MGYWLLYLFYFRFLSKKIFFCKVAAGCVFISSYFKIKMDLEAVCFAEQFGTL